MVFTSIISQNTLIYDLHLKMRLKENLNYIFRELNIISGIAFIYLPYYGFK